jgi:glutathione S-transferase
MAIRLFQFPTSMFCEKVRIVLALKKLPYEIVNARDDERKSLIVFSGQKKVPALDYHSQCVVDSTAICAFLDERHPEKNIYPARAADKGLCLVLEDWADEVLFQPVHKMRPVEPAETRQEGEKELQVHFRGLDQLLSGRKFIFDHVTLADIAIFAQLHYLYTVGKYEIPPAYRNVNAWMELMRQTTGLSSLYDIAA